MDSDTETGSQSSNMKVTSKLLSIAPPPLLWYQWNMIRCAFTLMISPSPWWYMLNEEISWTAILWGDKNDKWIILKLNIYGQNSRKRCPRNTAQSVTLRNGQSHVTGAPVTQPLCATTHIWPLLMVQFSLLPSLTPEPQQLDISNRGTFTGDRNYLANWSEAHV